MRKLFFLSTLILPMGFAACSDDGGSTDGGGGSGSGGAGATAGTSGGGGAPPEGCDTDYARIGADTTATSFLNDVMPIFQLSCTQSQCHCSTDTTPSCTRVSKGNLYLGVGSSGDITQAIADTVYANLVDVESATAAGVMRVASGDPASSFLVQKISDTHNDQGHTCTKTEPSASDPCGDQMPNVGDALCTAGSDGQQRFDTVARWVAQGAENN